MVDDLRNCWIGRQVEWQVEVQEELEQIAVVMGYNASLLKIEPVLRFQKCKVVVIRISSAGA